MPQSVSETSLVSNVSPIHLENSEIVLREDGDSTVLDVEEYVCTNREVVNLENAALNIDNSSDVIIGPVTQFNVNGNVTIYHNGTREQETADDTSTDKDEKSNNNSNGSDFKTESSPFDHCFKALLINRYNLKYLGILLLALLTSLVIASAIMSYLTKQEDEEYNYDYHEGNYGDRVGNHTVYYRKDWGGKPPKMSIVPLKHPVSLIIISHSGTLTCSSFNECVSLVKSIQKKHLSKPFRSNDIGYNFLIGGDGNVYVGRGWDIQNFHRKISVGIGLIGNFNYDKLSTDMIDAAEALINQGISLNKLSDNYNLVGENQTNSKMYLSPGKNAYEVVKHWPHFYNKTML